MNPRRSLIAIVDDEEPVRMALGRLLRASSYDVSMFGSGEQFLESLLAGRPDCVLLDLQMPGLTGRDVQRALCAAQTRLPVIVMTAHDRPTLRENCLADGAVAYLAKPLQRDILIAAIESATHGKPTH